MWFEPFTYNGLLNFLVHYHYRHHFDTRLLTLEATFSSPFCLWWLNLSNLRNFSWLFFIIFSCHFPTMCVMPVKGNGFKIYLAYKAAIRVKLFMLLSSSSLLLNSWLEIFINSLKENLWGKNFFISSQVYSFT